VSSSVGKPESELNGEQSRVQNRETDAQAHMAASEDGRNFTGPRKKRWVPNRWIVSRGATWQPHWAFIAPRKRPARFPTSRIGAWPRNGVGSLSASLVGARFKWRTPPPSGSHAPLSAARQSSI